jgi:hypothetical protein
MRLFDYHLREFTIAKRRYGLPMDEDRGTEPRVEAQLSNRRCVERRSRFGSLASSSRISVSTGSQAPSLGCG